MSRPTADVLDAAFAALADTTRRDMIRGLLHKPRRAGELAGLVGMSPQALSRHLRVLRKSGLVVDAGIAGDARVRVYSIHPEAFVPVQNWLVEVEEMWRRQLQSFKAHAESLPRQRKAKA